MSDDEAYTRLAAVYDEIVVDPCYDRWAGYLHDAWASDAVGVRTVLDVACGTGLLAAELVGLGYRVTGVDSSAAMLGRARELLGSDAVLVQVVLPDLPLSGVFDAAVSTFDGLNYLTPSDLRSTMVAVGRRLRAGGWFVFDVHTDAMMEFTAANPVVEGEAEGQRFTIASVVDVGARSCETCIDVTRTSDGDRFTERHRQYFFSDGELARALADAGFEVISVTDEYSDAPADAASLRATWVTRRA